MDAQGNCFLVLRYGSGACFRVRIQMARHINSSRSSGAVEYGKEHNIRAALTGYSIDRLDQLHHMVSPIFAGVCGKQLRLTAVAVCRSGSVEIEQLVVIVDIPEMAVRAHQILHGTGCTNPAVGE
jgi:hypothetical protein